MLRQAAYLSSRYQVVIANPPYMGGKGMNPRLATWLKANYPDAKSDLMTAFMERCMELTKQSGFWGMINLPSWMFLSSYEKLRLKLLETNTIDTLVHLGRGIFGSDFGTVAFTVSNSKPKENSVGVYRRLFEEHVQVRSVEKIESLFLDGDYGRYKALANDFRKIPGCPFAYWISKTALDSFGFDSVDSFFTAKKGMAIGDNAKFLRIWAEVSTNKINYQAKDSGDTLKHKWYPCLHGGSFRKWSSNKEYVVNWKDDGEEPKSTIVERTGDHWSRYIISTGYFFSPGINWTAISSSSYSARYHPHGFAFTSASMGAFSEKSNPKLLLLLVNSKVGKYFLSLLSPTLNYGIAELKKIPYKCEEIVTVDDSSILSLSLNDWDSYETSWDFTDLPLLTEAHKAETLSQTYKNLRHHWQSTTTEMQKLEQENNRIFIEAYNLQDELTPEVPLKEITLTCNPHYRYGGKKNNEALEAQLQSDTTAEFLSYATGCMLGRYSIDKPGLILANQGETLEDYLKQVTHPRFMPDKDNVIPIIDFEGDWFEDDISECFKQFLKITFGTEHFEANLQFIENSLGKDIKKYFLKDFYPDHIKRYKKRPIYWLFSSPKGSFNALVYMHRYQPDTASVVLNNYLREFRTKLTARKDALGQVEISVDATKAEKTRALKTIANIDKVLSEVNDYERDILYPLATRQIEIDLDDGVKVNYPKLGKALKKVAGLS
uniref:site-specific DNA-methyltransferase (adenine-specific) n=1 Tax=uncultured Thiotrichaceae bacterium TaxID=298394 RepID=A0A6S6S9G7_9GAMM|nr:MAG: putative type II restriction enzyme methylase subunit [uncultured Thiotrichaceae bacterium]